MPQYLVVGPDGTLTMLPPGIIPYPAATASLAPAAVYGACSATDMPFYGGYAPATGMYLAAAGATTTTTARSASTATGSAQQLAYPAGTTVPGRGQYGAGQHGVGHYEGWHGGWHGGQQPGGTQSEHESESEAAKRQRRRESNRRAAALCRKRKLDREQTLRAGLGTLLQQHTSLKHRVSAAQAQLEDVRRLALVRNITLPPELLEHLPPLQDPPSPVPMDDEGSGDEQADVAAREREASERVPPAAHGLAGDSGSSDDGRSSTDGSHLQHQHDRTGDSQSHHALGTTTTATTNSLDPPPAEKLGRAPQLPLRLAPADREQPLQHVSDGLGGDPPPPAMLQPLAPELSDPPAPQPLAHGEHEQHEQHSTIDARLG